MTKLSTLLVFIVLCSGVLSVNENESENEGNENCKTIYTYGYGYRQFFHLSEAILSVKGDLVIKLKVQAKSDAHILLSPTPSPEESDPVYEIVLGAGRNSFSDIRRKRRAATRASAFTRDILSSNEPKGFWIRLSTSGMIAVGKEGNDVPFIYWQDTEPLVIKYISFCTWSGIVGKWLHECDEGKYNEVIKNVSTTVRLREDLLKNYDRYSRPALDSETTMPIVIGLVTDFIQLDAKKSKMTLHGSFSMVWFDEKMQWEPIDYDNITTLYFINHELWAPELVLFNAVGNGASPLGRSQMMLSSLGQVNWKPDANLEVRCYLNLTYWPWDTQTCTIQLGFWSEQDALQIIIMENGTQLLNLQKTASEWYISGLVAGTLKVANPLFQISDSDGDEMSLDHAVLTYTFTMNRFSTVYCYVLLFPLLATIVMSVSSFWMSPFSHEKMSINCLALLILCAMLITIQQSLPAPADHTPYLLRAYSHVMIVVAMSTVMSVVVTTIARSVHLGPPPKCVCSALNRWVVNTFLCLPEPMSIEVISSEQSNEDDSRSFIQCSTTSLVTVKDIDANQYWSLLAISMDRITFIIISLTLALLLIP